MQQKMKLRLRRVFRRRKKVALEAADQAEQQIERLFFRRLARLTNVRRFITGWIALLVLLVASVAIQARGLGTYYQRIAPVEGGTFREGIIGTFTNANPLYAATTVDGSISRLLFSGLFAHDSNNQLVPDVADSWEADENGQIYKVHVRKNIFWHDGKPLTAADVVFTYQTIQKPDAKSPLGSSWAGVGIKQLDDYTVEFSLPSPLASFPYSLTNGIVPKHILADIPAGQLRSVPFNTTAPVGTGPFRWSSVEVTGSNRETRSEQVALVRNENYHLGIPKIEKYVLKTFRSEDKMIASYQSREIAAMVGLDSIPEELAADFSSLNYSTPMDGNVMLFLNNSSELLKDVKLRRALVQATNTKELLGQLSFTAIATHGPLLKQQVGYDPTVVQSPHDPSAAAKLFDEAGWPLQEDGLRKKDGQPLTLRFISQNVAEYATIAQQLQKQWKEFGVTVDVGLRSEEDMQSSVLTRHEYDVLLYGITIGIDPDVFAFWHSSQVDVRAPSRLNLSEYKSKEADKALEAGRTRVDPALRAVKYKPFLVAWRDEAPAIALYQPRFLYITRSQLNGYNVRRINTAVDRLYNIQNWTVLQDKVLK
jgi:peptide/nickel transport system substrate-binding protein